jgi:NADPH-dependent 2,4-dienoyl-CoA reductase/sulfur reductase-like enzyme/nitrite reductase/ring-hydroxylating ferredoxin subunit
MVEADKPEGPDLSEGVAAGDIAEGAMVVGHVGQDAVLIARANGALHAIGATCPHYGGPLGEGLIVGDTIRCPWHHARFCLKTGEAVGAPAFDPVRRWEIEERDGMVFVRPAADPPAPAPVGAADQRVVIIGGGAAGFAAAEMLRRKGFAGLVTMLSDDTEAPYDRPSCSKEYLEDKSPREQTPLRDPAFYADAAIDLRLGAKVLGIDPAARTVEIADQAPIRYDVLILATGAEPQRPPAPGLDGPGVFALRTLADADALIEAARTGRRAAVVGSSFIGLEVAAALRQRGLDVTVIAPEATPLEKVLGREVGRWLQGVHEAQGVVFRLETKVLCYADGKLAVDHGEPVEADLVVVGTGVKPRVELAAAAGLKVDDGVIVDDRLRTSAEGVYAVGDIARYPDPMSGQLIRVEHWVHAERQGQHVARLILGDDQPFAEAPFFWTKHYERSVSYSGHAGKFDPPEIEGSVAEGDAVVRYREAGRLAAVATIDRNLEGLQAEADFQAGVGR